MYKMARKPVPQYVVDAAPQTQAIMIEDFKFPIIDYEAPSLPSTPQFRGFPGLHNSNSTDTFYPPGKMSSGRILTGTQELAEFLKTSKPEDFGGPGLFSSVDDISLSSSSAPKKRRFLRTSLPREGERARSITPQALQPLRLPHVVSKTTSKGAPYLQIHVDYGNNENSKGGCNEATVGNADNVPSKDKSGLYYNKEIGNRGHGVSSQNLHPHMNIPLASPPPWSPPRSSPSAVEAMDVYQSFLRSYTEPPQQPQRRTPILPTLQTDLGGAHTKVSQAKERPHRTLHTPSRIPDASDRATVIIDAGTYYGTTIHQDLHVPSGYEDLQMKPKEHSAVTSEGNVSPTLETMQVRKLPRPGPPPSKELPRLPSLPEVHDLSTPSGPGPTPRKVAQRLESTLPASPIEKLEPHTTDRRDRVKARKARDLQVIQQRKLQEAIRLLDADVEAKEKGPRSPEPVSPVSPISVASGPIRRHSSRSLAIKETHTSINARISGSSEFQQNIQLQSQSDTPQFDTPRCSSPLAQSTPGKQRSSKRQASNPQEELSLRGQLEESLVKQTELEHRLEIMENRYMILEQALITVLQRTSPHRSESNSIENLLADFRITYPCRGWSDAFPLERDLSQTGN